MKKFIAAIAFQLASFAASASGLAIDAGAPKLFFGNGGHPGAITEWSFTAQPGTPTAFQFVDSARDRNLMAAKGGAVTRYAASFMGANKTARLGDQQKTFDYLLAFDDGAQEAADVDELDFGVSFKEASQAAPKAPSAVPLPAAAWLFGSAVFGFVAVSNRRKV